MAVQVNPEMQNVVNDKTKSEIKVLVVDDREDNLFSIETILEKDGYQIYKATSGRAALKVLLHQHDFTLILMDVQMPDMNGFETASLIYEREKLKHIPIIFITAHNQGEEKMYEGYKMGGVDFIYKPINPELLRFKVSVFAELYRKNHQLVLQEQKLIAANENLEKQIQESKKSEEKIKLLNHQLIENNEQLKTTIEELDRFAYVASHDLQEPLRKIMLFSDKLLNRQKRMIDEDESIYLDKIVRASNRMQQLVHDLLKFSRHTDEAISFEKIDLNIILSDVLADIEHETGKKDASINADILPVIWGVPSQIRQLFQNLISNALKFTKAGSSPEINIRTKELNGHLLEDMGGKPGQVFHQIIISDNGIGFDPKYANDIFVVFKRLHSYHEFEGTGIGLSICKKIIERHHGHIRAESTPDKGASFIITLPDNSGQNQKVLSGSRKSLKV
jgi:signal transduction histidine kinase